MKVICLLTLLQQCHSMTHPCQSDLGMTSNICKELRTICDEGDSTFAICDQLAERIDIGLTVLEPSAGKIFDETH